MYTTIQNLGGGHGIRIPEALLKALGLRENDQVELACSGGTITISRTETPNAETRSALEEVREMEAHPERFKSYQSFGELLSEVLGNA